MTDDRPADIADDFWGRTSGSPSFPRDVETAAADAGLPVAFVSIPGLTVERAQAWMAQRHAAFQFLCRERVLRGCIVAVRGTAAIFTDTNDSEDECRFTQAHEVAHYLRDYERPRQNALAAFGPAIQAVLDGDRPPTPAERVHAALAGVALGAYSDLLGRDEAGRAGQATTLAAELRADHLAMHLLAPPDAVLAHLPGHPGETERSAFGYAGVRLLCETFGLPEWAARDYGRRLWADWHRPDSRRWLGL